MRNANAKTNSITSMINTKEGRIEVIVDILNGTLPNFHRVKDMLEHASRMFGAESALEYATECAKVTDPCSVSLVDGEYIWSFGEYGDWHGFTMADMWSHYAQSVKAGKEVSYARLDDLIEGWEAEESTY